MIKRCFKAKNTQQKIEKAFSKRFHDDSWTIILVLMSVALEPKSQKNSNAKSNDDRE